MEQLRITRFGGLLTPTVEEYHNLETLIEQCDELYPGIDIWYKKKVVSGLNDKQRTAYVIYEGGQAVGAAVLRLGEDAKICSFRIAPEAEKNGYGKLLVALLARDLRTKAQTVHFTIPAHIWEERETFFEGYGFECVGPTNDQYRLFDKEFYCRGEFTKLWQKVLQTLPGLLKSITINGFNSRYDLVMSVRARYAHQLVSGKKTVEIRRRFSAKWVGSHTLVYSSRPDGSFVGSFRIANVVSAHPDDIWKTFWLELGCSEDEYRAYTRGARQVFAVITEDATAFKAPIPTTQISHLMQRDLSVPQSYCKVSGTQGIEEAACISTFLQATM